MSQLFDLHIQLRPSTDYRRLGFLLIALTVLGQFYASPPWWLLICIVMALSLSAWHLVKSSYPHPDWRCLFRQHEQWILKDLNGQQLTYDKMDICLDTGFFILIKLTGVQHSKMMVIFYDQLPRSDLRKLIILNTIL